MGNEKYTLPQLVSNQVFQIPDYQRGYAWESKQVNDLIQDVDALVDDSQVRYHYTGTIVLYDTKNQISYKKEKLNVMDVVDGQQRLTSIILYLSVILSKLEQIDSDYRDAISKYLFDRETPRIKLGGSNADFFLQLLKNGGLPPGGMENVSDLAQRKLLSAAKLFRKHADHCDIARLQLIFEAITNKIVFTSYSIAEECEIGMTFELMNSRGKNLSDLELLKNYLMYWAFRNTDADDASDRENLTRSINRHWANIYSNLGKSNAADDQCLRITWTLLCSHLPKNWHGYDGFKDNAYIPIRDFRLRSRSETREFIETFIEGLDEVSIHYSIIYDPKEADCSADEYQWLLNIHHTGNIANFLPLLVAARIKCKGQKITESEYLQILKGVECFAYRVFLWERRRSNAGKSNFYRWGKEYLANQIGTDDLVASISNLTNYYSPQTDFVESISKARDWYAIRNALKYTLFEYEKSLLHDKYGSIAPKITWEDLANESTIEHILPQDPKKGSKWFTDWTLTDMETWRHDIGNLVLTRDNSRYLNFDFIRKRDGKDGCGEHCYSDSEICQERNLRFFKCWTKDSVSDRHDTIIQWILTRWKPQIPEQPVVVEIDEGQDEDSVARQNTDGDVSADNE